MMGKRERGRLGADEKEERAFDDLRDSSGETLKGKQSPLTPRTTISRGGGREQQREIEMGIVHCAYCM
jgi:hypothetical protein